MLPVLPVIAFIGSFGGRLRGVLLPSVHTPSVPRVEGCDSVDVQLWLLRGTFERRDCDDPIPELESERICLPQLRTIELTGSRLFSSEHLLFG